MRTKWLGDFAGVLHINPREVDALRLRDFCQLILWLERYREDLKNRGNDN